VAWFTVVKTTVLLFIERHSSLFWQDLEKRFDMRPTRNYKHIAPCMMGRMLPLHLLLKSFPKKHNIKIMNRLYSAK